MNSPGLKKIIMVNEDGSREELKKGTVICRTDKDGNVRLDYMGVKAEDILDITDAFVEMSVENGCGIWTLSTLSVALMNQLQGKMNKQTNE